MGRPTNGAGADDRARARRLLTEASELLGEGRVLLQLWSSPVVEWVFVGLEDDAVVVSDNGEAFAWIAGLRGQADAYLPWSTGEAERAAARFGVEVRDEGGEGYEAFRLARTVGPGESVAEIVQAVARAIDGTLAVHTPPDSPTAGSFFWDHPDGEG